MISELAQDLLSKISTVGALGNRVGMAAAGGATDPSMKTVPLPAAWLLYNGDVNTTGDPLGRTASDIEHRFSLSVMISYVDQTDILNNQLPLLEAVARSVSGKNSTNQSMRWRYQGAQLVDIYTDRLVYELNFTVSTTYMV